MTITNVKTAEGYPRRNRNWTNRSGVWLDSVDYVHRKVLYSDTDTEPTSAVEAASGFVLGQTFAGPGGEADANARCMRIDTEKIAKATWTCTANYTSDYQSEDPFAQKFTYGSTSVMVAFVEDEQPVPVQNSATDKFIPSPSIEEYGIQVNAERLNALGSIDLSVMLDFNGATNDAAVTWDGVTWAIGTLLFTGYNIDNQWINGTRYLNTRYTFLGKSREGLQAGETPHDISLLDVGFNVLDDQGIKRPYVDPMTNQKVETLLDGAGKAAVGVPPAPPDPTFIRFKRKAKSYATFPFTP